ncbi:MAG TPA: GyrI-like domain-containing protein [Candidatus Limnocylindrales bacterium]|nr:GyrI-like domain-containing protein [Candidatus Limnocylindrales bacterium]
MVVTAGPVIFEHPVDRDAELRGGAGIVRFLDLPATRAVMIDGDGAPGPDAFVPRMPGLYTTAYKVRFGLKARGVVTKVGPLEGLWWTSDGSTDLDAVFGGAGERGTWRWTLLIALPDEATDDELERAVGAGRAKLGEAFAPSLRIEALAEGRVAQLLHLGPYATERASIERLHAAVAEAGLRLRGRHHELYLGNPQASAPGRLRTILRHPVE